MCRSQFHAKDPGHILPRFNPLFKAFIKSSKQLFQFIRAQDKPLVSPILSRARPLQQYGISTFMAMISANIAITGGAASGLHRALCAIGGKISNSNSLPLKLRVGRFQPKQLFPWKHLAISNILHSAAHRLIRPSPSQACSSQACSSHDPPASSHAQASLMPTRPLSFILACPKCHKPSEARLKRLYSTSSRTCIVYCKDCHRSSSARKWQCACCIPWISCPTHRALGFTCMPRTFTHASAQHNPSYKRPRLADPIRQLGSNTSDGRNSISIAATTYSTSKRSVSASALNPPPKRRELAFTPGPKLVRRILAFEEAAV